MLKWRELRDRLHVASSSRGNTPRKAAWRNKSAIVCVGGEAWELLTTMESDHEKVEVAHFGRISAFLKSLTFALSL